MTPSAPALSIAKPDATVGANRRAGLPPASGLHRPGALIGIGLLACGAVLAIDLARGFHLHAPRLRLLLMAPAVFRLHVTAAFLALGIGIALLVGVKGRAFHRVAGWTWVVCMMTVAISSFWITDHGRYSWLHFFSGWTSITAPMAVAAIKRRDVRRHRAAMINIFMGGLVIAGAFTFVPGRLMWRIFVG